MSQVASILQRATRNKLDRLEIISFPCHERWQNSLSDINANFYLWQEDNAKKWNYKYGKLPKNHTLLNPLHKQNQLPDYVTPDLILMQNKLAEYSTSLNISRRYNIPIININHCLPWIKITKKQIQQIHDMRTNIEVFITRYSRDQWGYDDSNSFIIEHGIDTDLFRPQNIDKEYDCIVVCNDYIQRNWCCGYDVFCQVTGHPNNPQFNYKVLGSTPGLSEPANNVNELISYYNKSKIFLCTATVSPISMALLEAMACGLPVVALSTCAVPEIITHAYNGMISEDPRDLQNYCRELLMDEGMRIELGNNARKTIEERFNLNRFTNQWEKVFRNLI